MTRLWLLVCTLFALSACDPTPERANQPAGATQSNAKRIASPAAIPERRSFGLTVYGYNYTDTYIDSFEVNGQGGGNLEVSIPTAGGGGSVCCVSVTSDMPLPWPYTIKWSRNIYKKIWCEQTVLLHGPIPREPRYFEVHFYPDGHIELAVTEEASEPRLKLERFSRGKRHESGNSNNDTKFSKCKHGY